MKKIAMLVVLAITLGGNAAYAQPTARASTAAKKSATDDFAWGIGLVSLAVLGVVVGVTAAAAAHTPSSHSH